jgi:hypothetical protein
MTEVPVWWFDGSDLDAVAFGIADNKTADYSSFDDAELVKLLDHLRQEDSLEGVGFREDGIDALVQQLRDLPAFARQQPSHGRAVAAWREPTTSGASAN